MARRTDRVDPQEDGVGVAVEIDRPDAELVTGRLALAPEAIAGARVEVGDARVAGDLPRLLIHPREHQHGAVRGVLDDGGGEPVRAPERLQPRAGTSWRGRGAHAATSIKRTASPAEAIADLISA